MLQIKLNKTKLKLQKYFIFAIVFIIIMFISMYVDQYYYIVVYIFAI